MLNFERFSCEFSNFWYNLLEVSQLSTNFLFYYVSLKNDEFNFLSRGRIKHLGTSDKVSFN